MPPRRPDFLRPSRLARAVCIFGIVTTVACAAPQAGPRCRPRVAYAPWDAAPPTSTRATPLGRGLDAAGPGDALIAFYQRRMRAPEIPGAGCRFRPSCSTFAREAVRRWSIFGFVLIVDRLFVREHPFMDASYLPYCPKDGEAGGEAVSDPVP
jgi:putative component of membrane protein insertase Oxa1/YidC/SpoIIIJ protein YidD